jgi:hypothetical protein
MGFAGIATLLCHAAAAAAPEARTDGASLAAPDAADTSPARAPAGAIPALAPDATVWT